MLLDIPEDSKICSCHGENPDSVIQCSVWACLMFLWMLSVSLTSRKLFFETSLDSSSFNGCWIPFVQCKLCYLFWQPSLSGVQREMLPSVLHVFFIYFLYFNVFKQVNFVEFTHLPKFLISAIQARGFACRASVWGCGRERLGGRKRCYLSYWLLLHFFHLSLSVQ